VGFLVEVLGFSPFSRFSKEETGASRRTCPGVQPAIPHCFRNSIAPRPHSTTTKQPLEPRKLHICTSYSKIPKSPANRRLSRRHPAPAVPALPNPNNEPVTMTRVSHWQMLATTIPTPHPLLLKTRFSQLATLIWWFRRNHLKLLSLACFLQFLQTHPLFIWLNSLARNNRPLHARADSCPN